MSDKKAKCNPEAKTHEFDEGERCQCGAVTQAVAPTVSEPRAPIKARLVDGKLEVEALVDTVKHDEETTAAVTDVIVEAVKEERARPFASMTDAELYVHGLRVDGIALGEVLHEFSERVSRARMLASQAAVKCEEIRQAAMRGDVTALWSQLFLRYLPICERRFGTETQDAIMKSVREADAMASLALKTISEQ